MDITRRSFLGGALTVAATAVSVPALAAFTVYPTLYGDGIHDDTVALNAFLAGKPVMIEGSVVETGHSRLVDLNGGHFLLSDTLILSDISGKVIQNVRITTSADRVMDVHPDCHDCALEGWLVEVTNEPFSSHPGALRSTVFQSA